MLLAAAKGLVIRLRAWGDCLLRSVLGAGQVAAATLPLKRSCAPQRVSVPAAPDGVPQPGKALTAGAAFSGSNVIDIKPSGMARGCHLLLTVLALVAACLSGLSGLGLLIWCLFVLIVAVCGYRHLLRNPAMRWFVDAGGLLLARDSADKRWARDSVSWGAVGVRDKRANAWRKYLGLPKYPGLNRAAGLEKDLPRLRLQVVKGWQIAPWWLQLHYRPEGQSRWRTVLLWPDSTSSEALRLLRSEDFSGTQGKSLSS